MEYTQNLVKISSLILGIKVPENLASFVHEAKYCYAFSQYIAVYALCRTILETAIRDICIKKGIIRKNKNNIIDFSEYHRFKDMVPKVARGNLKNEIVDNYKTTSCVLFSINCGRPYNYLMIEENYRWIDI